MMQKYGVRLGDWPVRGTDDSRGTTPLRVDWRMAQVARKYRIIAHDQGSKKGWVGGMEHVSASHGQDRSQTQNSWSPALKRAGRGKR